MSDYSTLDFLNDLVLDGVNEIRRTLFRQVDETLLQVLANEFAIPKATVVAEVDRRIDDIDENGAKPSPSRSGRVPQFTSARVIRDLRRLGFVRRKSTGGHRIFVHPTRRGGHVAVPHHPGDLPRGTLTNILRQATQVLGYKLVFDSKQSRLVVEAA